MHLKLRVPFSFRYLIANKKYLYRYDRSVSLPGLQVRRHDSAILDCGQYHWAPVPKHAWSIQAMSKCYMRDIRHVGSREGAAARAMELGSCKWWPIRFQECGTLGRKDGSRFAKHNARLEGTEQWDQRPKRITMFGCQEQVPLPGFCTISSGICHPPVTCSPRVYYWHKVAFMMTNTQTASDRAFVFQLMSHLLWKRSMHSICFVHFSPSIADT